MIDEAFREGCRRLAVDGCPSDTAGNLTSFVDLLLFVHKSIPKTVAVDNKGVKKSHYKD